MTNEEVMQIVLQKAKEGMVVYLAFDDELMASPLDEFIKQPTDGILYDLNRDKATVLTFLDDPKWINDFAVALVIERLKKEIDDLQGKPMQPEMCKWTKTFDTDDGETVWQTGCGKTIRIYCDILDYHYCPFCGKQIEQV
jgi:hypothetical protein